MPAAAVALATEPVHPGARALAGIAWVAVGTQFLGLIAWYRGMAAIGVARASQLELARPLLTLVWAAALLGEHLSRPDGARGVGGAHLHRCHPTGPQL